LASLSREKA